MLLKSIPWLILLNVSWVTSPAQLKAMVANAGSDSATIFDPLNSTVITQIPTGKHPQHINFKSAGKIYILNMGTQKDPANTIDVVDLNTKTIIKTISLGDKTGPHWGVLSNDKKILWVACASQNSIVEIDTDSDIPIRSWDTHQPGSYNFTVSRDGSKIYSANFDTSTVSIIDRTNGNIKIISIGGKPIGIDASPDGKEIWISSNVTNEITVLDAKTNKVLKKFPTTGQTPCRIKFTNNGKFVLVTQADSKELTVFNALTKQFAWKIRLDGNFPKGLAVSPDDKQALVSFGGGNSVAIIDLENKKVVSQIQTGLRPEGAVYISN